MSGLPMAPRSQSTARIQDPCAAVPTLKPGLISRSGNPRRKYPRTLEMIREGTTWIVVNTMCTNHLITQAEVSAKEIRIVRALPFSLAKS